MHPDSVTLKTRRQIDWATRAAEEARNRIRAARRPPGREVTHPAWRDMLEREPAPESDLL